MHRIFVVERFVMIEDSFIIDIKFGNKRWILIKIFRSMKKRKKRIRIKV